MSDSVVIRSMIACINGLNFGRMTAKVNESGGLPTRKSSGVSILWVESSLKPLLE